MNIYDNLPSAVLQFLYNNKTLLYHGGGIDSSNKYMSWLIPCVEVCQQNGCVCVTAVSLIVGKSNVTEKRKARLS